MTSASTSFPPLLILGASTRAAAYSALRAGYRPICADLFLDEDLQAVAQVLPISDYPGGYLAATNQLPSTPWIYTGGLENYPDLIAEISSRHPLLGNPPNVLKLVRNPDWLREVSRENDFLLPESRDSFPPPAAKGTWLLKPLDGSGGGGIERWTDASRASPGLKRPHLFQKYLPGLSCSALFLAGHFRVDLIALFEQLSRKSRFAPPTEFSYQGSLYHADTFPDSIRRELTRIGHRLAEKSGMRGLFGVDFLWEQEQIWILEVNPRYTASVELWELSQTIPLLREHCQIFEKVDPQAPILTTRSDGHPLVIAKQILYAPWDLCVLTDLRDLHPAISPWEIPTWADIPHVGTLIREGEPICTLIESAPTRTAVFQQLSLTESRFAAELGMNS